MTMVRRDFVRWLPSLAPGVLLGTSTLVLGSCGGVSYVVPRAGPAGLSIPASTLAERGEVFVQSPAMTRPIYVRRDETGMLIALLASCTHQGCQPDRIGDRLACPCHGSEFSLEGDVLEGPADRPLARYRVSQEGPDIIISLRPGVER